MRCEHIHIDDCTNLELHIYVLGYYPMGESQLIVIWDSLSQKAIRSILIDCFEINKKNEIHNILDKYCINKRKLDFIIWTHPDLDHSVGFSSIVSKYASQKTCSLIPNGMTNSMFWKAPLAVKKSWISIKHIYNRRKYNVVPVNASNEKMYPDVYCPLKFEDGISDPLEFGIEILTPFAERVFRNIVVNKTNTANNISISLAIRFGECNFYFGGDVENPSINMVDATKLCDLNFIKIPHHGSKSSSKLPKIITSQLRDSIKSIAITTCFKKTHIPTTEILDKYKNCCKLILRTDNQHKVSYGIWKLIYGIRPNRLIECSSMGDAIKYYG